MAAAVGARAQGSDGIMARMRARVVRPPPEHVRPTVSAKEEGQWFFSPHYQPLERQVEGDTPRSRPPPQHLDGALIDDQFIGLDNPVARIKWSSDDPGSVPVRTRPFIYKVILMGESAVGKTSLIHRYVENTFHGGYLTTMGVAVSKNTQLVPLGDGRSAEVRLLIWDVMGQKGYMELLREAYFPGAHGALAVFDVTRWETLEGLKNWIKAVQDQSLGPPIVILGNKSDLHDRRAVSDEEGQEFSLRFSLPYMPTSAKTGLNVQEAFGHLARQALRKFASLT